MAMNVFGTRDPFTKRRDPQCKFGSAFGLGLFGGIRFRTKMNTLGLRLFLEFHSHMFGLLFMVSPLCGRPIDCRHGCHKRRSRRGRSKRRNMRNRRNRRNRRRKRHRRHGGRSSVFLNNERGLLCHREILFWQGKIGVLFSLTTSSYSYGLGRFFRNSKYFHVTHPILERDQKEPERDIEDMRYASIQVS